MSTAVTPSIVTAGSEASAPKTTCIVKQVANTLTKQFTLHTGPMTAQQQRLDDHCKETRLQQTPGCYTLSSQLEKYKDKNHRFKDVVFAELFPGRVEEILKESMGTKNCAFVVKLRFKWCNNEQNLGSRNINNFDRVAQQFPHSRFGVCAPFAPKSHPVLPS